MPPLTLMPGKSSPQTRFEALVRPHYDALYRIAWRWTRSVEDAEDLVQETCARAYRHLAELELLEQPKSWMMRVMYRLFVDLTRRHDRRKVVPLDSVAADALISDAPRPDESAERARNAERVARVWQRLDREKQALLALHDIEGYTLAEITAMTGLKEGTLKSRLHRSRALLGRLLDSDRVVLELKTGSGGTKP